MIGMGLTTAGFSAGWMSRKLVHSSYRGYPGISGHFGWPAGSTEAQAHNQLDKILRGYSSAKGSVSESLYGMGDTSK